MKIKRPTLLLDRDICIRNISEMVQKAHDNKVIFRPHFKTHQSGEVGEWFKKEGVEKICVSSVIMAQYFVTSGWNDITIAFPVNINEIEDINELASSIKLNLLVENIKGIQEIDKYVTSNISVFIKIDTGYHRTGVDYNNFHEIKSLLDEINKSENIKFVGFLSHFGNTYNASSTNEIDEIYNISVNRLLYLKSIFIEEYPKLSISVGDTPSASIINNFSDIDELRPGNFVFYDLMQYYLGSCTLNDIALCLACPIVAKHETRSEIVIYGGAVHLSNEFIYNKDGYRIYGLVALFVSSKWEILDDTNYVKSLSQEHGVLNVSNEVLGLVNVGETIGVIPVHSCLTANLAEHFVTTDYEIIRKM